MGRLTADQLRRSTLRRQFPAVAGRGPEAVLELLDRVGPVQSQVPRAPFLTAASRLPGVAYETVNGLLEEHRLVKASTLRGTVHVGLPSSYGLLDAVARPTVAGTLTRALGLTVVTPAELAAEIERFCADRWRTRDEIVDHVRGWLSVRDPGAADPGGAQAASALSGHGGLLRRPRDGAWERRTDVHRRTATAVIDGLRAVDPGEALVRLVRGHLAAYGPVLRDDLVFFFGVPVRAVTAALAALGDEVVRLTGPGGEDHLDLAEPPTGGSEDPGVWLLPEFDGLLLGFHGRNRTRFVDEQQLPRIWSKVNGVFSPVVLHDGRLVATWRTVGAGRRVRVEVTMLPPYPPLPAGVLDDPVADTASALGLTVTDVAVRDASVSA